MEECEEWGWGGQEMQGDLGSWVSGDEGASWRVKAVENEKWGGTNLDERGRMSRIRDQAEGANSL